MTERIAGGYPNRSNGEGYHGFPAPIFTEKLSPDQETGVLANFLRQNGFAIIGASRRVEGKWMRWEVDRSLYLEVPEGRDPESFEDELRVLTGVDGKIHKKPSWAKNPGRFELVLVVPKDPLWKPPVMHGTEVFAGSPNNPFPTSGALAGQVA